MVAFSPLLPRPTSRLHIQRNQVVAAGVGKLYLLRNLRGVHDHLDAGPFAYWGWCLDLHGHVRPISASCEAVYPQCGFVPRCRFFGGAGRGADRRLLPLPAGLFHHVRYSACGHAAAILRACRRRDRYERVRHDLQRRVRVRAANACRRETSSCCMGRRAIPVAYCYGNRDVFLGASPASVLRAAARHDRLRRRYVREIDPAFRPAGFSADSRRPCEPATDYAGETGAHRRRGGKRTPDFGGLAARTFRVGVPETFL